MKLQRYKNLENENGVSSRKITWRFGSRKIDFILTKQRSLIDDHTNKTVAVQIMNKKPIAEGEQLSILTFGIKIIRYGKRVKFGWIRRKQLLEKV